MMMRVQRVSSVRSAASFASPEAMNVPAVSLRSVAASVTTALATARLLPLAPSFKAESAERVQRIVQVSSTQ